MELSRGWDTQEVGWESEDEIWRRVEAGPATETPRPFNTLMEVAACNLSLPRTLTLLFGTAHFNGTDNFGQETKLFTKVF